jgi:hypothetical protein
MVPPTEPFDWSVNDLPPEWIEPNGKVKKNYRALVPRELHVHSNGAGPDFPSETFRVLKEKEIARYGEYRTKRLALEAWQRFGHGIHSA